MAWEKIKKMTLKLPWDHWGHWDHGTMGPLGPWDHGTMGPLGPLGPWDHWDHGTIGTMGPWDHWDRDHFVILSPGVRVSRPPAAKGSQKTYFLCIKTLNVFKKHTFCISNLRICQFLVPNPNHMP